MAMPTLADYQYMYTDNGTLLNGDGLSFWDVDEVIGLDFPEMDVNVTDYDGADGGAVTALNFNVRTIVIKGTLYANPSSFDAVARAASANFLPRATDEKFWYKHPGLNTMYIKAKPVGFKVDTSTGRRIGSARFLITLEASDPRIYQDIVTTNFTLTNAKAIVNAGLVATYPVLTLAGAFNEVTIAVSAQGSLVFKNVAATSGHTTTIDMGKRIIRRSGVNISNTYFSGKWPALFPGTTNWTVSTVGGSPTVSIAAQSAWML